MLDRRVYGFEGSAGFLFKSLRDWGRARSHLAFTQFNPYLHQLWNFSSPDPIRKNYAVELSALTVRCLNRFEPLQASLWTRYSRTGRFRFHS